MQLQKQSSKKNVGRGMTRPGNIGGHIQNSSINAGNKNVLIIGGTGFIGGNIASRLDSNGYRVFSLSRNPVSFPKKKGDIQYFQGTLNNINSYKDIIDVCDTIIHAASDSVPADTYREPLCEVHNNLLPTISFLELLQSLSHKHVIYLSSGGAIYGHPDKVPVTEDSHCSPLSYHGAAKLSIESFLYAFTLQTKNIVTVLRPSNIYGPGQRKKIGFGLIQTVLNCLADNQEVTIMGDGTIEKDYLHVYDLADACEKAVCKKPITSFNLYNVGYGKGASINKICVIVERETGRTLKKRYISERVIDPKKNVLDISRIRSELGWEPQVSLSQGIREMWALINTV